MINTNNIYTQSQDLEDLNRWELEEAGEQQTVITAPTSNIFLSAYNKITQRIANRKIIKLLDAIAKTL